MAQKLFCISEKGPLSRSARSHANLLRSGSVPPLQRLCQEAVLRASWEKCVACTCCRASRPRALECTVYGQSAKRDVIPYLHAGLRGVIGTYEGRNHRWEGRNPLFTCGLEGRNRDVRRAYNHRWEGRNPLFTFGFEGHNRTYEGRNHTWEGRDPLFTCGFEEQSFRVAWSPWSLSTWGSTPLACFRATCLPKHNPLQLVSSQFGSGECVWLSVGLCSNGAATRARFWGRIRI